MTRKTSSSHQRHGKRRGAVDRSALHSPLGSLSRGARLLALLAVGGQWELRGQGCDLRRRQPPPGMQLALSSGALPSRGRLLVTPLDGSSLLAHPGALLVSAVPGLSPWQLLPAYPHSASAMPAFLFAFHFCPILLFL